MSSTFPRHLKSSKKILSLLQQCHLTMKQIHQIHASFIISGTLSDPLAAGELISFTAISHRGDLEYAHLLFRHLSQPPIFVWNTMMRAFTEKTQPVKALGLYKQMLENGHLPNNYTFSFILRSCIELSAIVDGKKFHSQIVKLGWESYDFVLNGLIHMYASCDSMDSARNLFDRSLNRDVISWTAMVSGYAKSGEVDIARDFFDRMPERNVVSWSAMITSYSQFGMYKEALDLFNQMLLCGLKPNYTGIVAALSACSSFGALEQGKWIHAFVGRNKMEVDRVLGTALIDMYAKCGCIETASGIFDMLYDRDVFAWTAMISGLANHGNSKKAIELFVKMQNEGVKPNEITFICVLSACSRMGFVEEGQELFQSMNKVYGIEPGIQHYGCLVDLLGRAGMLEEAKRVVKEMPIEPDSYVLGALLNACRVHGEIDLGEETVESLANLSLDHSGVHVLLSNIYASANRWEDVAKIRKVMKEKSIVKVPGCSSIEIDGAVVEFVVGDKSHLLMEEMMLLLHGMDKQLKSIDFDSDTLEM